MRLFLFIVSLLLIPGISFAKDSVDKIIKRANSAYKKVVILEDDNGTPFCSGVVVKGANSNSYILTAGHCCGIYYQFGIYPRYELEGKEYSISTPINLNDMALNAPDICAFPTEVQHNTSIKIAPYWEEMDVLLLQTKYPIYMNDPDLPIQIVMILGIYDKNFSNNYVVGDLRPGMSGSPIFDSKMNVVAIAVIQVDTPTCPVGMAAPLTNVIWPDHKNKLMWAPMPKNKVIRDDDR